MGYIVAGWEHKTRWIGAIFLANIAIGLLLFTLVFTNELLWWPRWLEGPVRLVHNVVFGSMLPAQAIVGYLRDRTNPHSPLFNRFIVAMLTPPMMTVALLLLWRLQKRAIQFLSRKRTPAPPAPAPPVDSQIPRRLFLVRTTEAAGAAIACSLGAYATVYEPRTLALRRYTVPIAGLPPAMDGYTIAQISDTHYGPFISLDDVMRAIDMANACKPDFTVLTGDYVSRTPKTIPDGVGILSEIRARHGVAAVLGNHDHWEGRADCRAAFQQIGLPLIDNGRLFLTRDGQVDAARGGDGICLAGVGDLWEDVVDVRKALQGVDPDVPRIMLSHNPDVAEDLSHNERIDLMFSGHTHGGQISVPYRGAIILPSAYGRKYEGGYCMGPRHPVIVSRGVGLVGVPYRFRVQPEVVVATLRVAKN
jgi:predicted MPP superfamily phosphohydrolase